MVVIDYIEIKNTLDRLDVEYNNQMSDIQMPILFSKLAVLEFCGWIEESFDDVLYQYIGNHIVDSNHIRITKKLVENNYGFDYEKHTFKLFSIVLGINNWENILDKLSTRELTNFQTILKGYSKIRNNAAHTYTPIGTTRTYDAPSVVLGEFNKIKIPIQIIEKEINLL